MKLSSKTGGDRIISRGSFVGGLNTTSVPEMIADNQMSECVNMDFNKSNGALQTACGSFMIFKAPSNVTVTDMFFDKVNNVFLVITSARNIYKTHLIDLTGSGTDFVQVGTLNGTRQPKAVMWEYGLIIASGGRLQYWNGKTLSEIALTFEDERNSYDWEYLGNSISATAWSANTAYEYEDIVTKVVNNQTKYYTLITGNPTLTSFVSSEWKEMTINANWEFDRVYDKYEVVIVDNVYYRCKYEHTSITDAPTECKGVFVKNGRVWTWAKYTLKSSGVGDERMWSDISSDDSSSKWVDVGYKEGEENTADILGVTSLSSDIIILKGDGKVYRLAGNYPDWNLIEVARNINALNSNCYTAIQDGVFILSRNSLFYLQTTTNYGDVEPQNIAINVRNLFNDLSIENSRMEFIPSLNQIWITSRGNDVIVFDVTLRAFLKREFKNRVVDVVSDYISLLLVREDKVTQIEPSMFIDEQFSDNANTINWRLTAKTDTVFYNLLLKRVRAVYVPFSDTFGSANVIMAKGQINIPLPASTKIMREISDMNVPVTESRYPFAFDTKFNTKRMVYRNRSFDMKLSGTNAPLMINRIDSDLVEVG